MDFQADDGFVGGHDHLRGTEDIMGWSQHAIQDNEGGNILCFCSKDS